jgi:hypothetical protein
MILKDCLVKERSCRTIKTQTKILFGNLKNIVPFFLNSESFYKNKRIFVNIF